jgi:hypothetical protein
MVATSCSRSASRPRRRSISDLRKEPEMAARGEGGCGRKGRRVTGGVPICARGGGKREEGKERHRRPSSFVQCLSTFIPSPGSHLSHTPRPHLSIAACFSLRAFSLTAATAAAEDDEGEPTAPVLPPAPAAPPPPDEASCSSASRALASDSPSSLSSCLFRASRDRSRSRRSEAAPAGRSTPAPYHSHRLRQSEVKEPKSKEKKTVEGRWGGRVMKERSPKIGIWPVGCIQTHPNTLFPFFISA